MKRVYNFYAGPAILPLSILEKAAGELTDFRDTGMSVMELSHRSKPYEAVHNEAIANIRELYKVPDNYHILFLQGGASTQFFMVPMNLIGENESADYILTGSWAEKALKEAERSWIKWRDDEAMLMARVGGAVGGSGMRVDFANAQLKLINQRIEVLSEYLKQSGN